MKLLMNDSRRVYFVFNELPVKQFVKDKINFIFLTQLLLNITKLRIFFMKIISSNF